MFLTFPTKEISFNKIRKIKIKKIIYHNPLQLLISSITIYFSFQRRKYEGKKDRNQTRVGKKEIRRKQDGFIQGKKFVFEKKKKKKKHSRFTSFITLVRVSFAVKIPRATCTPR